MRALVLVSFLFLGCATVSSNAEKLPTVSQVELPSYLGLWYEILRLPNSFQDEIRNDGTGFSSCFNTTAEYGLLKDGRISVKNTCYRQKGSEVKVEEARAKARATDKTNSKLKVNFTGYPILERLGIGDGDYWILELGPKDSDGRYSYSLVGEPSRKFMWILSRVPTMDQSSVDEILKTAKRLGFATEDVVYSR